MLAPGLTGFFAHSGQRREDQPVANDLATPAPDSVLFWSGAGLSMDTPTNGPSGVALTQRTIEEYMTAGTTDQVASLYRDLQVGNAAARPRLETVLDALTDVYGLDVLPDVLSDMAAAPPNRHHEFMARHLDAGGYHVTTNFDTCIERAGHRAVSPAPPLVHVHGYLADGADLGSLGARLGAIENGLPDQVEQVLDAMLGDDRVRTIAFLGYSGSDFFDVTPYLLSRTSLLRSKRIVWLGHAPGPLVPEHTPTGSQGQLLPQLASLATTDATGGLDVYRGMLDDFLAAISERWALPSTRHRPSAAAPTWTPKLDRTPTLRRAATTALYSRMGYRQGVIDAYATGDPHSCRDWERLADALWGAGRYAEAERAWMNAYPGATSHDEARRVERRGAVLWIRGDLRRAERLLWTAIQRWCGPDADVAPDVSALILETYGRVIEHMRRLPGARLWIPHDRVAVAYNRLQALLPDMAGTEGLALRVRLQNVAGAYGLTADPGLDGAVVAFAESEALNSWLSYEHARLRRLAADGAEPDLLRGEYARLVCRQERLGAMADAARTYLLPQAMRFFTPWHAARSFRSIEMTCWHRFRLFAGMSLVWARFAARAVFERLVGMRGGR